MENLRSTINQTGGNIFDEFKFVRFNMERYSIVVKLSTDNKFIGIVEIGENKEFLNSEQKLSIKGFHDVSEFYQDPV